MEYEDTARAEATEVIDRARSSAKSKQAPVGVINLDALRGDTKEELVLLHLSMKAAADDLDAGLEAVAKKAGIGKSVLRRYISALAGAHYEEHKRDAEQLCLLFDEA